jgi:hypothetical protein
MQVVTPLFENIDNSVEDLTSVFKPGSHSPSISSSFLFLFYIAQKLSVELGKVGEIFIRVVAFIEKFTSVGLDEKKCRNLIANKLIELKITSELDSQYENFDNPINMASETSLSICSEGNVTADLESREIVTEDKFGGMTHEILKVLYIICLCFAIRRFVHICRSVPGSDV